MSKKNKDHKGYKDHKDHKNHKDHKDHKKPKTSEKYIPGTEIEVEQFNIILTVPKDAVALEVAATFLDEDGELYRAKKKLSASAIHDARQAFLDNVEGGDDYDAQFVLAPEGLEAAGDAETEAAGDAETGTSDAGMEAER